MVALPDPEEIAAYARANGLESWSRARIAQLMLSDDRRQRDRERGVEAVDADFLCAGLKNLQAAADAAGLRPEVLAAAVPAVASRLVAQSLTPIDNKKDTTR